MGTQLRPAASVVGSSRGQWARVARRVRALRRPRIPVGEVQLGVPTVYFLADDSQEPCGGSRLMYRHIDVLNAAGVPAAAMHQRPGFRYQWFENATRTTDVRSTTIGPEDVLIVPEIDVDLLVERAPSVRHIVLNQSGHLTWTRRAEAVDRHYRSSPMVLGSIVVSEHSLELLSHTYPNMAVRRVRGSVDPAVFYPAPEEAVIPRRISYLPRRGRSDVELVLQILRSRGALDGWRCSRSTGCRRESSPTGSARARSCCAPLRRRVLGCPRLRPCAAGTT